MNLKNKIENYLGRPNMVSESYDQNGNKQICDLQTGECYIVREKDGLIERFDNQVTINKKVKVETHKGIKQLLND